MPGLMRGNGLNGTFMPFSWMHSWFPVPATVSLVSALYGPRFLSYTSGP